VVIAAVDRWGLPPGSSKRHGRAPVTWELEVARWTRQVSLARDGHSLNLSVH
jgi:hypothetical protein